MPTYLDVQDILEDFADGVVAIDKNFKIISFSRGAERITGYSASEAIGRKCQDVLKGKLCKKGSELYNILKQGVPLSNFACEIHDIDDKKINIVLNASPFRDITGKIIGVIANFRDIEEVYKLHAALFKGTAQLFAILNSITDGVLTIDNEWRITSFNRAAEKITGYRAEQVIGKLCQNIFQSETCKTDCPLKQTMITKHPLYDYEIEIINANNEAVPISVNTALLIDEQGETIGGIESFRDLSLFKQLKDQLESRYSFGNIIGKDKKMQEIYSHLEIISKTSTTVLITGETGTGKELVARAIHHNSERKDKSFIKVDCTALPETLLESELFGYKKGAFTDAWKDKPGKFSLADNGTIFLDEIGELSLSIQAKLLRVLEEQAFEPLGAVKTVNVDVRVIVATNQDLLTSIKQGKFREDLYYRLNVFSIHLPPLRERPEDIPLFIEHFIGMFKKKFNKTITKISQDAMDLLLDYDWPGNVRQLEHAIEHAFIHCAGRTIQKMHLPAEIKTSSSSITDSLLKKDNPLRAIEKQVIQDVLKKNRGSRKKTAQVLGISPVTLWRKMQKYGIE